MTFKINDKVKMKKEVVFNYEDGSENREAEVGDILKIDVIDDEGYWLKDKSFYIEHGCENEYFELV